MEVAPFFVDFHHFLSIFTIFYWFSRFTHFCRDLHFVAIYALLPQIFFGQNSLLRNITRFLHVCPEQPPDFLWDIFCCCDAGLRWWDVWSAWIQTISFDVWVSAQRLNTNFSDCGRFLKSQNRKTVRNKKMVHKQLIVAFFFSFGFWVGSNISGDEL